jgi:hypothetical protein
MENTANFLNVFEASRLTRFLGAFLACLVGTTSIYKPSAFLRFFKGTSYFSLFE